MKLFLRFSFILYVLCLTGCSDYPEPPGLLSFENATEGAENYIHIGLDFEGASNRNGIGAKVEIFRAGSLGNPVGRLGTKIISVANGYSSAYEAIAHFGLPKNRKVDIRVTKPCDGPVYKASSIKRNQLYTIKN